MDAAGSTVSAGGFAGGGEGSGSVATAPDGAGVAGGHSHSVAVGVTAVATTAGLAAGAAGVTRAASTAADSADSIEMIVFSCASTRALSSKESVSQRGIGESTNHKLSGTPELCICGIAGIRTVSVVDEHKKADNDKPGNPSKFVDVCPCHLPAGERDF